MPPATAVRASDTERERVAKLVSDAAGEGRLTLAEADERLNLIYAARYRHELDQHVADLPADRPKEWSAPAGLDRFPTRLRVHAGVALVFSVLLIVRWVASGVPFFWPAGPLFFLWGSLAAHAMFLARAGVFAGPPWARQGSAQPWAGRRRVRSSDKAQESS